MRTGESEEDWEATKGRGGHMLRCSGLFNQMESTTGQEWLGQQEVREHTGHFAS